LIIAILVIKLTGKNINCIVVSGGMKSEQCEKLNS